MLLWQTWLFFFSSYPTASPWTTSARTHTQKARGQQNSCIQSATQSAIYDKCWSITACFHPNSRKIACLQDSFITCRAMMEKYREMWAATSGGRGEGWNANFYCLSHTAALTVWHVWWMVLPCYCCPLTSTHCHQSTDKKEKKSRWKEKGKEKHPAARAMDVSFHQHTHTCRHTPLFPFSQCNCTGADIKAHTHTFKCALTSVIAPW